MVALKFLIIAVIGAVASFFTKPKWYYIDHQNHMLAKALIAIILFGGICVAPMKRIRIHPWSHYLYLPYLVVGVSILD